MYVCMYFIHVVTADGSVVAEMHNVAVPSATLEEIVQWKKNGATYEDVIKRLRLKCVPPGFVPKPWSPGMYIFVYFT